MRRPRALGQRFVCAGQVALSLIAVAGTLGFGSLTPLVAQGRAGQGAPPRARAVLALVPDTVRVGEPFTLGVAVRVDAGAALRFSDSLLLGDGFEQRGAVETRRPEPGVWRADYRLVSWTVDPGPLPDVEVELVLDGQVYTAVFVAPPLTVLSVLPADEVGLELRDARPFLERSSLLWLLLLLALTAALLAWLYYRRRSGTTGDPAAGILPDPKGPVEQAQAELAELRDRWNAGALGGPELHDGLEATLRVYAEATRDWPPGTPIGQLPNGDRELAAVLQRSARTRFGRLEARSAEVAHSIDVCEDWLLREQERELERAHERRLESTPPTERTSE